MMLSTKMNQKMIYLESLVGCHQENAICSQIIDLVLMNVVYLQVNIIVHLNMEVKTKCLILMEAFLKILSLAKSMKTVDSSAKVNI